MADYLYNGVELPELPEWDKEKYPYAVMFIKSASATLYLDSLSRTYYANGERGSMISAELYTGSKAPQSAVYQYNEGDESWTLSYETQYGSQSLTIGSSTLWANYDILNTSGKVYLAASDPVPVVPVTTHDPTSILMGWLAGKRMAAMRGKDVPDTPDTPDVPDTPTGVYDDTFPIEWTLASVANNANYNGESRIKKISSLTPTVDELKNATLSFNVSFDGETLAEDCVCSGDTINDVGHSIVFFASSWLVIVPEGDTRDEPGLYWWDNTFDDAPAELSASFTLGTPVAKTPIAYLYPSVVLPDIDTVWDKTVYPYAYICRVDVEDDSETTHGYALHLSDTAGYRNSEADIWMIPNNSKGATYFLTDGTSQYVLLSSEDSTEVMTLLYAPEDIVGEGTTFKCVWCSADICGENDDTTVYLEAFDPIPTSDGMVCYKGAVLPEIKSYEVGDGLDLFTICPYHFLVEDNGEYTLRVTDNVPYINANGYLTLRPTAVVSLVADDGEWHLAAILDISSDTETGFKGCHWTNTDILNTDGTTYLATSEPVPVYE